MDNHNIQEYLGVDVGQARVGIARGNSIAKLAQPLKTVAANDAFDELLSLAKQNAATAIVIGLPRGLDGHSTPQTETVRRWAQELKQAVNLPMFWQDEALTSQAADKYKEDAAGQDAVAAAIILQDFLDSQLDDRVAV